MYINSTGLKIAKIWGPKNADLLLTLTSCLEGVHSLDTEHPPQELASASFRYRDIPLLSWPRMAIRYPTPSAPLFSRID